jgi:hypothetical protein
MAEHPTAEMISTPPGLTLRCGLRQTALRKQQVRTQPTTNNPRPDCAAGCKMESPDLSAMNKSQRAGTQIAAR